MATVCNIIFIPDILYFFDVLFNIYIFVPYEIVHNESFIFNFSKILIVYPFIESVIRYFIIDNNISAQNILTT